MSNIQRKRPTTSTPAASSSSVPLSNIPPPAKGDSSKEERKRMSAWLTKREKLPQRKRFNYGGNSHNLESTDLT